MLLIIMYLSLKQKIFFLVRNIKFILALLGNNIHLDGL